MGAKERKSKRRSGRNARNGIICELNQSNNITTSEIEIENNMKKSDESSLKDYEELGVEESTMDSKSAEFEKPISMKSEPRLKVEELKSKHLYACSECPKSYRTSLHLRVHYFLHFPSTRNKLLVFFLHRMRQTLPWELLLEKRPLPAPHRRIIQAVSMPEVPRKFRNKGGTWEAHRNACKKL